MAAARKSSKSATRTKKTTKRKTSASKGRFSLRPNFSKTRLVIFALIFANVGALIVVFTYADSSGLSQSAELDQYNRINAERKSHRTRSVSRSSCLTNIARNWAKRLGDTGVLAHSTDRGSGIYSSSYDYQVQASGPQCPNTWSGLGENVGRAPIYNGDLLRASLDVFNAYLGSPNHHANIDNTTYDFVGTAAYKANNMLYTVQVFADCNRCSGGWSATPSTIGEPSSGSSSLLPGQTLTAGKSIYSPERKYRLVMQSDGNLVLYSSSGKVAWQAGTYGNSGAYAILQSGDGNFVVYKSNGQAKCHTGTGGLGVTNLNVEDTGRFALYNSKGVVWASNDKNSKWICL